MWLRLSTRRSCHKDSYPHNCRADNASYRHDSRVDKNPYQHDRNMRFSSKLYYALFSILTVSFFKTMFYSCRVETQLHLMNALQR